MSDRAAILISLTELRKKRREIVDLCDEASELVALIRYEMRGMMDTAEEISAAEDLIDMVKCAGI